MNLKTIFTMGAIGTVATFGGTFLMPVFGAVAGGAAAAPAATHGSVLASFWAPVFTDLEGNFNPLAAIGKIASGFWAFGASAFDIGGAVINAGLDGTSIADAAVQSWNEPYN